MKETILRYRILKHEELPETHKQALRERGIDPDERWTLYMSFNDEVDAMICVAELQEDAAEYETFKMVDAGETEYREVSNWF